jgi:hypothetical protein
MGIDFNLYDPPSYTQTATPPLGELPDDNVFKVSRKLYPPLSDSDTMVNIRGKPFLTGQRNTAATICRQILHVCTDVRFYKILVCIVLICEGGISDFCPTKPIPLPSMAQPR